MANYRTTSSMNSAFKMPLLSRSQPCQPLPDPETLLFNDIIEEKSLAIRNKLTEFLKVASYTKFDAEFNNFLSRTDQIMRENSHVLRPVYPSHIIPVLNEPTSSLCTPQTMLSIVNSNDTTGVHNREVKQFIPDLRNLQPRMIPSLFNEPTLTPALCNTVNESQNNPNQNANQSGIIQPNVVNAEKYLVNWSAHLISNISNTKVFISITGSLLNDDGVTVAEKTHNAGTIIHRNNKNYIRTSNGLYRLTGGIISGSPDEFYRECLEINGIPPTWKNTLRQVPAGVQNEFINLPVEYLARPIIKTTNLDTSLTRSGKLFKNDTDNTSQGKTLQLPSSTPKKTKNQQPTVCDNSIRLLQNIQNEISRKRMRTHSNEL